MKERPIFHGEKGTIDVSKDPFAYNKDFDPNNPEHFKAWLNLCPSHLVDTEWMFALGELKLLLEGVKNEADRSKIFSGWKSQYKLFPEQK